MTRDPLNPPSTRSWRDIPQPVVPRAMSSGGRWRLAMAGVRITAAVAALAVFGWGAWLVNVSVRKDTRAMPAAAKATPIKTLELRTDGVLDNTWLSRTLALQKNASLMELDLLALRARLLAEDQVMGATLTKHFPDRLVVQITERSPVARVMTRWLGQQKALLVARDGIIYAGEGYDPTVLESLPWLDGVKITPEGGGFRPIENMGMAAELLIKARLEAEHLYSTWNVVSLSRLATDRKIEVRTKDRMRIVYFSTEDDFFRQLAKLDYITDHLMVSAEGSQASIDLSLGQDVPVLVTALDDAAAGPAIPSTPVAPALSRDPGAGSEAGPRFRFGPATERRSEQALFVLPQSQPKKSKREL